MHLDESACYSAIAARDRRFEGRFVVAVRTTRIYCRPGCPARIPLRKNVSFYACPAAAEEAGYRPCFRCRPDASPDTAAWMGTSATVRRALSLLSDEGLGETGVDALAERLGIGARHLRRLFAEQVGAAPSAIAQTRRLHFARRLLEETALPVSEVAFAAGFSSLRRFNDAVKRTFQRPPSALRRERRVAGPAAGEGGLSLRVPVTSPYDAAHVLAFLRARAIPGVESVEGASYARTLTTAAGHGVVRVTPRLEGPWLEVVLWGPVARELFGIVARLRGLFDTGADVGAVAAHLSRDPSLADLVRARPGLRVPGAWDGFETAVRAILGQQVSVAGATTLAGRLARQLGEPLAPEAVPPALRGALTHVFPGPARLAEASLEGVGLPRARAGAIRALASAVARGELSLQPHRALDDAVADLTRLPGIGPWTAQYIAMRVLREPDALPASDLVLRARLGGDQKLTTAEVEARAEAWRPFRAYGVLHVWTQPSGSRPGE